MKKKYALASFLIFVISCSGQNIISSLKDKNGDLWFTVSERGVYHYDGKSFVNFTKESYVLNINATACIYEDRTGNLWFNTDRGLCYYDGKKFTDFKIPFPPSSMFNPAKYAILLRNPIQVVEMLQDKAGNFWFLTINHGVYRYDRGLNDHVVPEKSPPALQTGSSNEPSGFTSFLVDETPNCILETKKGDIFIGSWQGGGVYRYDGSVTYGNGDDAKNFTHVEGFSDGMIACFLEDKTGKIWVGTRNAYVDRYDPSAELKTSGRPMSTGKASITNFSKKDGLSSTCIYCVFEDSKGTIWLGSDAREDLIRGDAFCYNPAAANKPGGKSFTNITVNAGLTKVDGFVYDVKSIAEDKAGNIWIGSKYGLLFCYDGKKLIDFSESLSK